jgi:hypothetical protein
MSKKAIARKALLKIDVKRAKARLAKAKTYTINGLTEWQMLALEVALERQEKAGGYEGQSLKALMDKIISAKPNK